MAKPERTDGTDGSAMPAVEVINMSLSTSWGVDERWGAEEADTDVILS
jgi:hypothetical protein